MKALLQRAVALDLPYSERPPSRRGLESAVLVLIGLDEKAPSILITRRTETVERHKGQMAFPGGVVDPVDLDPTAAALRETSEEVGIEPEKIETLGELPGLFTITGFWITPVVGLLREPLSNVALRINPHEIAETLWVPLETLRAPGIYRQETLTAGSATYAIHAYYVRNHRIWGATGAILKNLLDRLAALG